LTKFIGSIAHALLMSLAGNIVPRQPCSYHSTAYSAVRGIELLLL
jgi:hypothetical protein